MWLTWTAALCFGKSRMESVVEGFSVTAFRALSVIVTTRSWRLSVARVRPRGEEFSLGSAGCLWFGFLPLNPESIRKADNWCDAVVYQTKMSELLVKEKEKHGDLFKDTYLYAGHLLCWFESVAGNPGHLCRFSVSFCILWVQFVGPGGPGNSLMRMEKKRVEGGRVGAERWVGPSLYPSMGAGLWGHGIQHEYRDSCLNVGSTLPLPSPASVCSLPFCTPKHSCCYGAWMVREKPEKCEKEVISLDTLGQRVSGEMLFGLSAFLMLKQWLNTSRVQAMRLTT